MNMDQELMTRIIHKDKQALDELYHKYIHFLYPLILNELQDTKKAEEVITCLFKEIWNHPRLFEKKFFSTCLVKRCRLLMHLP